MNLIVLYIPVGSIPPREIPKYLETVAKGYSRLPMPNTRIWYMPIRLDHPHPHLHLEVYKLSGNLEEDQSPVENISNEKLRELLDSVEVEQVKQEEPDKPAIHG